MIIEKSPTFTRHSVYVVCNLRSPLENGPAGARINSVIAAYVWVVHHYGVASPQEGDNVKTYVEATYFFNATFPNINRNTISYL